MLWPAIVAIRTTGKSPGLPAIVKVAFPEISKLGRFFFFSGGQHAFPHHCPGLAMFPIASGRSGGFFLAAKFCLGSPVARLFSTGVFFGHKVMAGGIGLRQIGGGGGVGAAKFWVDAEERPAAVL